VDEGEPLPQGGALRDAPPRHRRARRAKSACGGASLGEAVQVDLIKLSLKPPGTEHLKLKGDDPLSNFAFKFNLRRYTSGKYRVELARKHKLQAEASARRHRAEVVDLARRARAAVEAGAYTRSLLSST